MKIIALLISLFVYLQLKAQVTKVGNDTLLDIACWNIEWFGNTQSGPTNEPLQFTNVKSVFTNTDIDVWGLCELANPATFTALLSAIPAYDGVNSTFSLTQKMGMIWKKSMFDLVSSQNLPDANNFDFASRKPLEVILKTKNTPIIDTLYFYVVHLKANESSSDVASYNRRKASIEWLKAFIDQNRKGKKVLILGDWNDDIDESVITIGGQNTASPFLSMVNDSNKYFFPSMRLSKAGLTTYPTFNPPNMIDHICNAYGLKDSFYIKESALVLSQLGTQITNFINTTSDHYPVLGRYNFNRYPKQTPVGIAAINQPIQIGVYPNPASTILNVECNMPIVKVVLLNRLGITLELAITYNMIDISQVPDGVYILEIQTKEGSGILKIVVRH